MRTLARACTLALSLAAACFGETPPLRTFPSPPPAESKATEIFDTRRLFLAPAMHPVDPQMFAAKEGITPVFYEGEPYAGKLTRVFAWVGFPEGPGPFPGIVLVHGGGGTAYRDWVKLWMSRGYAAIAMDTNGAIPLTEDGMRVQPKTHVFCGPSDKGNGFAVSDQPPQDQWVYHAVTSVIRGHSLLRSSPRVDPDRIGITGISWGGVMTEIAAAVDTRFKCAAPVYGSGFLGEDSFWLEKHFQDLHASRIENWIRLWDPSQYVAKIRIPLLFVNGTNDRFFRLGPWLKTTRLAPGPVSISLRVRLTHGNPPHGDPAEIGLFMDSHLKGGRPLPVITEQGRDGDSAWVKFSSADDLTAYRFNYTTDTGPWFTRNWLNAPAKPEAGRLSATVPAGTTAYYFNLTIARAANISSPPVIP